MATKGDGSAVWVDVLRIGDESLHVVSYSTDDSDLLGGLTPAEREVVDLLLAGCSNREIADTRATTTNTVSKQLSSIYRKLGVSSRYEVAAAFAEAMGGSGQGSTRDEHNG